MSIGSTQSSINPLHLVAPARTVVAAPQSRYVVPGTAPFDAKPEVIHGVVPFHRMLESENLANPHRVPITRAPDTFEPTAQREPTPLATDMAHLLPKLGEVLPVTPFKPVAIELVQLHQVQIPATGRVLDLYL